MKKLLITAFSIICAAMLMFAFAACSPDGENGGGDGSIKTYVMEAEFTDLTGIEGGGNSAEASGVDMIYGNGTDAEKANWSGGYFIAFTHKEGVQLTFVFNSSKAASNATVQLRLGSEMGNLTFTPSAFEVKLNGTEIEYGNMTVASSPLLGEMIFYDKTITSKASLVAGENILTLTVLANSLAGGTTAGPIIDCVKITTNATLTWTEKTDNPGRRGEI